MLINLVFDVKKCNVLIFNYLGIINKNRLYTYIGAYIGGVCS